LNPDPLQPLHRDSWLLAVSKPAGLLSQPGLGPDQQDSLITRLRAGDGDLHLVHRLDRDTSGVLLLARGLESLRRCSALFAQRRVNKLYLAEIDGELIGRGCLDAPLARLQRQPPRYGRHPEGRRSSTLWRVRRARHGRTQLWLRPLTGRSHQLRAHLADIGHPIVGDPIYGGSSARRLHLHALALAFRHPFSGVRLRLRSPSPLPWPSHRI
jgi:tRNA pseudouridine32 synthase/23S rRNA pseudouridine746 synthase